MATIAGLFHYSLMTQAFKPGYTWPNPSFPFRIYFEHDRLRIFIIENIGHNYKWLSRYGARIQKRDFFFVYCGWNQSEWLAEQATSTLLASGLPKEKFFFLFNSPEEKDVFIGNGFKGEVINHNAWLDEDLIMHPIPHPKLYDAIYVGRRSLFKRHMLARNVHSLAIIAGNNHRNQVAPVPQTTYLNPYPLAPAEVCEKINQSFCGLILSEEEGACFASSEYLLCGVPVVSTYSKGGRDVWYDDYNSIICDPDPQKIADAVQYFKRHPRDPHAIRSAHINLAIEYRQRFINVLQRLVHCHGLPSFDVSRYFYENYYHKMRKSIAPDFESIFPSPS